MNTNASIHPFFSSLEARYMGGGGGGGRQFFTRLIQQFRVTS